MAKKRSCRRTVDEDKIHEKAVKIRKMTDEQLVHYVEDRVEKARSEGFHRGKEAAPAKPAVNIAATIGEAGICGWIRTTKDRKREHDWERADRKEDNNSEMEEMNDES